MQGELCFLQLWSELEGILQKCHQVSSSLAIMPKPITLFQISGAKNNKKVKLL